MRLRLLSTARLASVLFALAALVSLRADVVIDTGPSANLGTAGSHTVSGSGTTLTVTPGTNLDSYNLATDDLLIGTVGTGTLTATAGATVSVPGTGSAPEIGGTLLGFASGSSGTLTVSGGATFSSNWLQLGTRPDATGVLNVTGTGSNATTSDYGLWMFSPTSSINVSSGATLNTSAGDFYTTAGSVSVSSGAHLVAGYFTLDTSPNAQTYTDTGLTDPGAYSATATITGSGTTMSATTISLLAASAADTVSLTVADHAALTAGDVSLDAHTSLNASDSASLALTGGLGVGNGVTVSLATAATLSLTAPSPSSSANLTLDGGTLTLGTGASITGASGTFVGYNIAGTLSITGGATLSTGDLNVGYAQDGYITTTGSNFLLSGTGSTVNVSGTTDFNGSVTITDGGTFNSTGLVNFHADATISAGGHVTSTYTGGSLRHALTSATLTVTGTDSSLSLARPFYVYSNGTLTVADHASVTLNNGLTVGYLTNGTFSLSSGATATTSSAMLGFGNSASSAYSANVTVTGAGTTWTNSGNLTLGYRHPGNLTVSAGGSVHSTGDVTLGAIGAVTSSLTVTGSGSVFTTDGALQIGGTSPTGLVTIADHGLINAASTTVNNGDTLTLGSFGTLDTAALTVNSGGTVLAHDAAVFAFDLGAPSLVAPLTFGAASTFTADNGATIYLLLDRVSGFAAGTYALFSFAPTATLNGIAAPTFQVATGYAGFSYSLDLTSTALNLTVIESPASGSYGVAGLTASVPPTAVPEPATSATLFGLGGLVLVAVRARRRSL